LVCQLVDLKLFRFFPFFHYWSDDVAYIRHSTPLFSFKQHESSHDSGQQNMPLQRHLCQGYLGLGTFGLSPDHEVLLNYAKSLERGEGHTTSNIKLTMVLGPDPDCIWMY
jgi:hypothetical protein